MSEQKLEIFNVLNFLNSGYELEDILKEGNFGTFPSAEDCIDYLVENGKMPEEDESNLESLSITKLREIAKEKGIKNYSKMNKAELLKELDN